MGCNLSCLSSTKKAVEEETPNKNKEPAQGLATARPSSTTLDTTPPADTTKEANQSMYYFDAFEDLSEDKFNQMPEKEKESLAESIYYETRQTATKSMMPYPPATVPNPHPRQSIMMDAPNTLLSVASSSSTTSTSFKDTVLVRKELQEPRFGLAGYPGDLTSDELEQCLAFRRELKSRAISYSDMVYVYKSVEEEPYALCRFLRARKFVPEDAFDLIREREALFRDAQARDFYKDIDGALGCPQSVFLTQFPFFFSGTSRHGCPVAYFTADRLRIEGIDCVTSFEDRLVCYMWYALTHAFMKQVNLVQDRMKTANDGTTNYSSARCELVLVVDLRGLSRSVINSRTLGVFKHVAAATESFPEILNHIFVIHAPSFFSLVWRVIRRMVDPRTADKVEIHSDGGKERLLQLVDAKELLQDVGGDGPMFEQVLQQTRGDGSGMKQTTEFMSLSPGQESKVELSLSANEQANVNVYTNSQAGAKVRVMEGHGGDQVQTAQVKSSNGASFCANVAKEVKGPGKCIITVESQSKGSTKNKDHFLVVTDVVATGAL